MNKLNLWLVAAFMMLLTMILAACNQPATTASCGFVVGYDKKVREIIYPGQSTLKDNTDTVTFVPCNSRNYIINDGSVRNANGDVVGDRSNLISAKTKTGVPITIAARAFWTLNQDERAMRTFYNVCFKYECASAQDIGGEANFSTEGWNGMLAENFGPTMDTIAKIAASQLDDTIWQNPNPEQYTTLAQMMSDSFADVMRANLGYDIDLFCGSGNSQWADPDKPGEGEFLCLPVRIVVDDVQRGQVAADGSTEGVITINEQRLENAKALYGKDAGYWLGLQDSIEKCTTASVPCVFNIGGSNNSPTIVIPPAPVIEPSATPVPTETPASQQ